MSKLIRLTTYILGLSFLTYTISVKSENGDKKNSFDEAAFECHFGNKSAHLDYSGKHQNFFYYTLNNGRREFIYPINTTNTTPREDSGHFRFSYVPQIGGGEAHIRFKNNNYTYIIYDINKKSGSDDYNSEAGIIVKKGNHLLQKITCANPASIKSIAYNKMQRENFEPLID